MWNALQYIKMSARHIPIRKCFISTIWLISAFSHDSSNFANNTQHQISSILRWPLSHHVQRTIVLIVQQFALPVGSLCLYRCFRCVNTWKHLSLARFGKVIHFLSKFVHPILRTSFCNNMQEKAFLSIFGIHVPPTIFYYSLSYLPICLTFT